MGRLSDNCGLSWRWNLIPFGDTAIQLYKPDSAYISVFLFVRWLSCFEILRIAVFGKLQRHSPRQRGHMQTTNFGFVRTSDCYCSYCLQSGTFNISRKKDWRKPLVFSNGANFCPYTLNYIFFLAAHENPRCTDLSIYTAIHFWLNNNHYDMQTTPSIFSFLYSVDSIVTENELYSQPPGFMAGQKRKGKREGTALSHVLLRRFLIRWKVYCL